ncbi:MAG: hypothetical protein WAL55_11440 [Candidatus Acidiferrales bacterium]
MTVAGFIFVLSVVFMVVLGASKLNSPPRGSAIPSLLACAFRAARVQPKMVVRNIHLTFFSYSHYDFRFMKFAP